jgi:hypothetical protein
MAKYIRMLPAQQVVPIVYQFLIAPKLIIKLPAVLLKQEAKLASGIQLVE